MFLFGENSGHFVWLSRTEKTGFSQFPFSNISVMIMKGNYDNSIQDESNSVDQDISNNNDCVSCLGITYYNRAMNSNQQYPRCFGLD